MDLELFNVAAGSTGQWTRIACQYRSEYRRYLLSLISSQWLIGDFNAPSISQPIRQYLRFEFSHLSLFLAQYLLDYSILKLNYIISIDLVNLIIISLI